MQAVQVSAGAVPAQLLVHRGLRSMHVLATLAKLYGRRCALPAAVAAQWDRSQPSHDALIVNQSEFVYLNYYNKRVQTEISDSPRGFKERRHACRARLEGWGGWVSGLLSCRCL